MSLFGNMFKNKETKAPAQGDADAVTEAMLAMAERMLDDGRAEAAAQKYRDILELTPNVTAQYNLGSLYAQGKGVPQDFRMAAFYFRQAELNGDVNASRMVLKCKLDYVQSIVSGCSYRELYEKYRDFMQFAFSGAIDDSRIGNDLGMLGTHYINSKQDFVSAVKILRAGAFICGDAQSQNILGILYNAGRGVEKNDLISLYWFDRAAEKGIAAAGQDRDGILNAYRNSLSPAEFKAYMEYIAVLCKKGSEDVPVTPEKVSYWMNMAKL